jgi:transaldolase
MKFFLDTANLDEIREVAGWGVLDGVTTNPSLVAKEKMKFEDLVKAICAVCPGPVSAEAVSDRAPAIIAEGRALAALAPNIAVKIPITVEGLKAIKVLASEGVAVNTTLIFSPGQALLAAKAGARFVSPFIGRLDDVSQDGMGLIEEISGIFNNYSFDCQIIVASVRHPRHVIDAALIGADICTVPFAVMDKLIRHPLTDLGIEKFLKDWGRAIK